MYGRKRRATHKPLLSNTSWTINKLESYSKRTFMFLGRSYGFFISNIKGKVSWKINVESVLKLLGPCLTECHYLGPTQHCIKLHSVQKKISIYVLGLRAWVWFHYSEFKSMFHQLQKFSFRVSNATGLLHTGIFCKFWFGNLELGIN